MWVIIAQKPETYHQQVDMCNKATKHSPSTAMVSKNVEGTVPPPALKWSSVDLASSEFCHQPTRINMSTTQYHCGSFACCHCNGYIPF